ncbi:MAG: NAD(P)H-dependent oxidoreductase subunit E [Candidatus Heimdallarchaeota archaeon]|nr:NAD(P)H-dependent oxidoreductase subunit E [Candidatus Heimdallarchaeota archaeon]MCK5048222.1 NAD(P)H-dependent oxidoreductase subunit E [Candidatus Heimdallarchaeota archaeon]
MEFEGINFKDQSLISVLNQIHAKYNYIPEEMMFDLSDRLKISLSKIYGVITFYTGFKLEKPGKHIIRVCTGTACYVNHSEVILEIMRDEFGIEEGKTTEDGKLSVDRVACIGACALAPVMELDGQMVGKLTKKKVMRVLREVFEDD